MRPSVDDAKSERATALALRRLLILGCSARVSLGRRAVIERLFESSRFFEPRLRAGVSELAHPVRIRYFMGCANACPPDEIAQSVKLMRPQSRFEPVS